ncbi:hypothetical protein QCN37_gp76 [Arthrobacter phage Tatanka]|uniref:Uncharacterized protein n=1 Tax=Arthrobacter phage Tatanka TaxID=2250368 RepID=A0A2Z5HFH3_9CAUD|nr:hypothetical protein QCN37_gp76 [Arthrobacter phage Tatanka]AXC38700.1 hypothetical protein SEA_TATANKA_76 [Arthrobacter phage Tatanka]
MLPEAKVTILVETFNGVDVIQVPLAVKPELAMAKTFDLEGRPSDEHHIGFGCYALYDIDQNLIAHQETKPGVTMDWVILDMAREILRKRNDG